jgi:uncharacterized protein YcfJ
MVPSSLLEEAMLIPHRSSAVTLGSIARHATSVVVATFALCTPALSQTPPRAVMEGVLVTYLDVASREPVIDTIARQNAAQTATARAPVGRRRLGRWASIPGAIFGAMLGGAVDCLATRCTAQVPNGVWPGMFAGAAFTALAPRRAAGTFLGVGGGIVAGSLIGSAIEGGCNADHPCTKGVVIGAPVGATAGGLLAFRMLGP